MIKLLHFSDPHLDEGLGTSSLETFANKRALGFVNLMLRRRGHFRDSRARVEALARFVDEHSVDFVLCTGDYTALGTEPEIRAARARIAALVDRPLGFATVPGNHDLYVDDAPGLFESVFRDGLRSDLGGYRWDDGQPYVRFVGDEVAIVGLASSRPNSLHRSSGEVPASHLAALEALVSHPSLADRFVFIALHYAPRLWDGRPDSALHGLDNHDALLQAASRFPFGAIVFGHVHHRYSVRVDRVLPTLFGAGSATYRGRESAWLWSLEAGRATATPLGIRDDRWGPVGERIVLEPLGESTE